MWDALLEEFPDSPWRPWKPGVAELAGIEVRIVPSYRPGQWKLIRHDHCAVTGGDVPGRPLALSHESCTVLAESR